MRTVPLSRYTDPGFLAAEQAQVFSRAWLMAAPAWRVAQPGDYVVTDVAGVSVVVLRDLQGEVRAFRNTCRHRGTELLVGAGNVKAIRCPYHDWKYSLDGRLRHVPGEEHFEPLAKGALGLHSVRVGEACGQVWVTLQDHARDLHASLGGIVEEVAPYGLEDMVPVDERWERLPCNWKALLDNATESYHIPRVHGLSVGRHVTTRPEFSTYGDHSRLTLPIAHYGFRDVLDRLTARGGPYTAKQLGVLHKYVVFPNFLMNVLPYHLTVFQVWPDGPDACRFFYGFYERRGARGLEWLRVRATWAASRWIWREDDAIVRRFQAGARSGVASDHQRYHDDEVALAHFHATLSAWLAPDGVKP